MRKISKTGIGYEQRLQVFLGQIAAVKGAHETDLHKIMDTVPFRDLETALMMATMDSEAMQA